MGSGLRREEEKLARRRRATPLEVAMLATVVGKLEACEVEIYIQRSVGDFMAQC